MLDSRMTQMKLDGGGEEDIGIEGREETEMAAPLVLYKEECSPVAVDGCLMKE